MPTGDMWGGDTPPNPRDAKPGRGTPMTREQRRRVDQWQKQQAAGSPPPGWQPLPGQPPPPGWWMASDGRWYPPQPAYGPPAGYWQPPKSRGRGCLYGALGGVAVVLVLLIAIGVAASHAGTPGRGTPSHPAAADVSVTACGTNSPLGLPTATVVVHNHSSGTSDYSYSVSFLNPAGTVVSQGGGVENGIQPGGTAQSTVYGDSNASGSLTCKVVDVIRFGEK